MGTLDYIQHYHTVRIRVSGTGNLQMKLQSLDEVYETVLDSTAMATTSSFPATKLANFMQFRAKLRVETTEIDEFFNVNQINIYVKPVFTSLPQ